MQLLNFGESLTDGRPPLTAQQRADDAAHARAYLDRHDATDLAEMLGLAP